MLQSFNDGITFLLPLYDNLLQNKYIKFSYQLQNHIHKQLNDFHRKKKQIERKMWYIIRRNLLKFTIFYFDYKLRNYFFKRKTMNIIET